MAVSILFNEHVLSSVIIWFVLVLVILLIVDGFYWYDIQTWFDTSRILDANLQGFYWTLQIAKENW